MDMFDDGTAKLLDEFILSQRPLANTCQIGNSFMTYSEDTGPRDATPAVRLGRIKRGLTLLSWYWFDLQQELGFSGPEEDGRKMVAPTV
jgi:hypothetical protein